jgi:Arc/MetJ-type ribon-helix-helix transcriptional regulator
MVVPGGGRGRVAQVKLTVSIPKILVERIEERIRRDGSATNVADYLRQAAVRDMEHAGYGGLRESSPVDIAALGDPIKAARRR